MIERAWEKKIEPLTVRISTAVRITGLSRSRIYELIQSGDLETTKSRASHLGPVSKPEAADGQCRSRH